MPKEQPKAMSSDTRPPIVMIAGFGDGAEMFDNLRATPLAARYRLTALDLPGFGGTAPLPDGTNLAALSGFLHARAVAEDARIVLAHSASSIIASLAAALPGSPLETIVALEGNITADDAYYSGKAAGFSDATAFKEALLRGLEETSRDRPIFSRYVRMVRLADANALWQLGQDVHRFSLEQAPGLLLARCRTVHYVYNPENCPEATLKWLQGSPLNLIRIDGASHWPSVDRPDALSRLVLEALAGPEGTR